MITLPWNYVEEWALNFAADRDKDVSISLSLTSLRALFIKLGTGDREG